MMLEARLGATENWMLTKYFIDVNFRRPLTVTHPEINKQIDKSDRETWTFPIYEILYEVRITHWKKWYESGFCPNLKHFIWIKSEK